MDEPLTPSRLWQVRAPDLALAPGLERALHAGNSSLTVHPGTWKRCSVLTVATSGPWGVVLMEEGVGDMSANSSLSRLLLGGPRSAAGEFQAGAAALWSLETQGGNSVLACS